MARASLADLRAHLERALAPTNELDAYTRDHFADSRERIQHALNAQVVQPVGPTAPGSTPLVRGTHPGNTTAPGPFPRAPSSFTG